MLTRFKLLSYILLVFVCFGYSCDPTNDHNHKPVVNQISNDMEQGFWEYRRPNSQLIYKCGKYDDGAKVGQWIYYIANDTFKTYWKDFSFNENSKITYASDWIVREQEGLNFLATVGDSLDEFIVLIENSDIRSLEKYMDIVAQAMLDDVKEPLINYNLSLVKFTSGRRAISGTFHTSSQLNNYTTFVFYTVSENGVIDFSLKTRNDNLEKNKLLFNDVVYSLILNNEKLFTPKNPIESVNELML